LKYLAISTEKYNENQSGVRILILRKEDNGNKHFPIDLLYIWKNLKNNCDVGGNGFGVTTHRETDY